MNRKQREQQRWKDEGKGYQPKRNPPMPSPKVIPLKHKKKKADEYWKSQQEEDLER